MSGAERTKKPAVCSGVKALQDIYDRCIPDAETGCLLWAGAMSGGRWAVPMVGISTQSPWRPGSTATAMRAAWALAGRQLRRGDVVWRQVCTDKRCCNVEHLRAGPRGVMLSAVAATGRNRGKPERAVVCAKARAKMLTPVDVVRQAETMFAAGALQKDVRSALRLGQKTAAAIRENRHPNSAKRQNVVRMASVFALGGGA